MPIDPRIPLASQHYQAPDLLGMFGQAENLKLAQQRNKLADLAFAEKERAAAQDKAFAELYKGAVNPDGTINRSKLMAGAAAGGFGARIPDMQKGFADQDKARSDADKANFEALGKRLDIAGKAFGYVRANPTLEAANQTLDFLGAQGVYSPETVAQYKQMVLKDPTKIAGLAEQAFRAVLDAKDQMPKFETRDAGGTVETVAIDPVTGEAVSVGSIAKTQSPDSIASNATQRRGQNMVDARSREANQNAKAPAGYQWTADGKLAAIAGGPADKAATVSEGERNAAGFAERMIEADRIAADIAGKDSGAQKPGFIEQVAGNGMIGNASRSETRQQYRQAQEDWVRAKLRKESGAAIGAEEMEREISMYFPQIGDKPEVIEQKSRARATANQAMLKSSGRAAPKPAAPKNGAPDDIADLLEKYGK